MDERTPMLKMVGVSKSFTGVKALIYGMYKEQ